MHGSRILACARWISSVCSWLIAFAQSDRPKTTNTAQPKKNGPVIAGVPDQDWLGSKDCQIGVTRVYMREEVVKALEQPRLEATRTAAIALQRRERGKQARNVCGVLMMHARGVAAVREMLEKHDTDRAQDALDALAASWQVPSPRAPLTQP